MLYNANGCVETSFHGKLLKLSVFDSSFQTLLSTVLGQTKLCYHNRLNPQFQKLKKPRCISCSYSSLWAFQFSRLLYSPGTTTPICASAQGKGRLEGPAAAIKYFCVEVTYVTYAPIPLAVSPDHSSFQGRGEVQTSSVPRNRKTDNGEEQ